MYLYNIIFFTILTSYNRQYLIKRVSTYGQAEVRRPGGDACGGAYDARRAPGSPPPRGACRDVW